MCPAHSPEGNTSNSRHEESRSKGFNLKQLLCLDKQGTHQASTRTKTPAAAENIPSPPSARDYKSHLHLLITMSSASLFYTIKKINLRLIFCRQSSCLSRPGEWCTEDCGIFLFALFWTSYEERFTPQTQCIPLMWRPALAQHTKSTEVHSNFQWGSEQHPVLEQPQPVTISQTILGQMNTENGLSTKLGFEIRTEFPYCTWSVGIWFKTDIL